MAPFTIGGASLDVTVSVGATLIDGSLAPTEADGLVNDALSQAKIGRDRVVVILPAMLEGQELGEHGLGSPLDRPHAPALSS
jgi:hypothetical protein